MSPEKRITKAQMKQDKMVSFALKAGEYIQQRKNYFLYGAIGVAGIILIIFFIRYTINKKNQEAVDIFGRAQLASAMNQNALAITDYKNVLDEYGSAAVAGRACFFLAESYVRQRNYDSAAIFYQQFIDDYSKDKFLLPAAYAGGGDANEQQQQYGKAAELYLKAAEIANDDYRSPDYYLAAGRNFALAGHYDQAKQAYQRIIDKYRRSAAYSEARKKIAEIEYRN